MLTFIAVLALGAQVLTVAAVYLRGPHSYRNIAFSCLSFALLAWSGLNYANSLPGLKDNLCLMRFIMCFVVLQNALFLNFANSLRTNHLFPLSWRGKGYVALSLLAVVLALSPVLFTKVVIGQHGPYPVPGPGMLVFIIHAALSIYLGFRYLFLANRAAAPGQKPQLYFILFGSIVLWGIVPLTNFVLALTLHTSFFIQLCPVYSFIFAALIAYAIIRHKLFDIRLFVLRAGAYLFSVAVVSLFYIGPAILLATRVVHISLSRSSLVALVGMSLVLIALYRFVRRLFDRLTNRIFFRGYYEPQDVINQLSKVLVRSINTEQIKQRAAKVLQEAIRAQHFMYWLASDQDETAHHAQQLGRLFKGRGRQVSNLVVIDELQTDPQLLQHLRDNDVALVVRLRTTQQELGYLTLGYKESGQPYIERDKRLLSIASDEIAIALQNAIQLEETQHFNQRLQQKVSEATRELQRTNDKLKALDETKDEFISMASHQLRTPLTAVKGYLSMVLEGDAGELNANQRKLLEQSFNSSQRMVYLISDLLNLSRLNTGKFIIEPSPVDLAEVVEAEVEQLAETAKSRGLELTYERPATFPVLLLDETKIHQVVMNLIDNAIYYTPSGGTVSVRLKETPTAVEYTVTDTGIGVPKSVQHKLFAKFYRAQNAQSARPDGTGLGLFMAKKVVVAQGGAIIFESNEGKGSTFGFRFTKAQHLPPQAPKTGAKAPALADARR